MEKKLHFNHPHEVIGFIGNDRNKKQVVKFVGTKKQCIAKAHGYDRVEPVEIDETEENERSAHRHKVISHEVIGYPDNDRKKKAIVKFSGTELECRRKAHGYDRVEEIKKVADKKKVNTKK